MFIAAVGWGGWYWWMHRPVTAADGVLAPRTPTQLDVKGGADFPLRNYTLTPVARFTVEARVLGIERYKIGRESELSPVDFALGWGPMSDNRILSQLTISQGNRNYYYSWKDRPPVPVTQIIESSANMHLIPADSDVAARLDRVRVGQIVELRGKLVFVRASDGWMWRSSLTRSDSGNGACEVVWVQDVSIR